MTFKLPSRDQLKGLRRAGIFPFNLLVTRAVVLCGTLGALLVASKRLSVLIESVREAAPRVDGILEEAVLMGKNLGVLIGASALAALVAGVGATVVQSRGAWGTRVLRSNHTREGLAPIFEGLGLVVAAIAGLWLFYSILPGLLALTRLEESHEFSVALYRVAARFLKLVVVAAGVSAILGGIVSRLAFLVRHGRGGKQTVE